MDGSDFNWFCRFWFVANLFLIWFGSCISGSLHVHPDFKLTQHFHCFLESNSMDVRKTSHLFESPCILHIRHARQPAHGNTTAAIPVVATCAHHSAAQGKVGEWRSKKANTSRVSLSSNQTTYPLRIQALLMLCLVPGRPCITHPALR
jgi:hypothetical protein